MKYSPEASPTSSTSRYSVVSVLFLRKGVPLGKFDPKALEGIFVGYGSESHTYRVFNKSTGRVEESYSVVFKEHDGSQGGRDVTYDVDDQIHQDAIRRIGMGFILPIEGHLVADREELCSTQVEPSSTQVQQASPKEVTNVPTEEQEKDLHEEEEVPSSILDFLTTSNSSHDQEQPTHEVNDYVLNDDQGQVNGQYGDQNDQDDQVTPQRSNEEIEDHRKRRIERNLELSVVYLCFICASPGSTASTCSYKMKYQEYKGLYYSA
jgi:hypothetical protein